MNPVKTTKEEITTNLAKMTDTGASKESVGRWIQIKPGVRRNTKRRIHAVRDCVSAPRWDFLDSAPRLGRLAVILSISAFLEEIMQIHPRPSVDQLLWDLNCSRMTIPLRKPVALNQFMEPSVLQMHLL